MGNSDEVRLGYSVFEPHATSQVLPQNIRGHWSEVVDSILS